MAKIPDDIPSVITEERYRNCPKCLTGTMNTLYVPERDEFLRITCNHCGDLLRKKEDATGLKRYFRVKMKYGYFCPDGSLTRNST